MAVSVAAFRLTDSVMVIVRKGTRKKLECLNAGSILIPGSAADIAGMIEATCEGQPVVVFRRDLEERSVEITPTESPSLVKPAPQCQRVPPPLAWRLARGK